jgi:group I intron endonuclease
VIVYCIRNRVNGKVYVGKTVRPLRVRWNQHKVYAKQGKYPLYRAIRKYGSTCFTVVVLKQCSNLQELNEVEKRFISEWRTHVSLGGYNLTWGGDGTEPGEKSPAFGTKRTLRVRKVLSAGKIGDKNPSRQAAGPTHWNRGLTRSEETRAKIRAARAHQVNTNKGMRHSEETRTKIRAARARQATTPEMKRALLLGCHSRWHVRRKLSNPNCEFCR